MRPRPHPFAVGAAIPVAALLAYLSLGGLMSRETYARESATWAAQAVGQDWFDLLVAVPWLVACRIGARSGSYRWGVLLAGAYAYTVYEGLIYSFAIHFNGLFLVYCATVGVAAFGLLSQLGELAQQHVTIPRRPARLAAALLVTIGSLFALLWLAEDIPAVLQGQASAALAEVGLFSNPVHVIDLAFVLPAFLIVGVRLWRRQRSGFVYGPVLLAFGVLMAASIAGMLLVIRWTGGAAPIPVIAMMLLVTVTMAAALTGTARKLYGVT